MVVTQKNKLCLALLSDFVSRFKKITELGDEAAGLATFFPHNFFSLQLTTLKNFNQPLICQL